MALDEETLELVSKDGEMDYNKWPALLEPLLERLNQIVHNDFPLPTIPPPLHPPSQPSAEDPDNHPNADTQPPRQENQSAPRPLPPVPPFNSSTTSISNVPDSLQPSQLPPAAATIPDLVVEQLNYILQTLRNSFSEKPPHTIQRLAELVLNPTKHYKTLPAWLRAVDRVVSVTSTADIFPLPHAQPLPLSVIDSGLVNGTVNGVGSGTGGGGILWPNSSTNNAHDAGLGSDESLGGALLTPIPWLKNGVETMVGSSSDSQDEAIQEDVPDLLVPRREDGAVTQGELIRQEQEAGVIPVNQTTGSRPSIGNDEEGEDVPHARGPDTVDTVDTGLVDGKDVDIKITREKREDKPSDVEIDDAVDSEHMEDVLTPATIATPAESEGDGDIVLTDADGKTEEEGDEKPEVTGENVGPDATDASTV